MPLVTRIQQQKQRKGRYSIYIDGKYSFPLSDLELSNSGLREGQDLTAEELAQLRRQAQKSKIFNHALRYLALRPRSVHEVRRHLIQKGYEEELVAACVEELSDQKLLDDAAFARSWVESRQLVKPRSLHFLRGELRQKGIDKDISMGVIEELGSEGELNMLKDLINKKLTQTKYQDQSKLIAYLARQGFSYSQVRQALADLSAFDSEQSVG